MFGGRTGFVHMGGRVYDPRLGRFLSPDPIVSEPPSGQGWNPYSYVGNSPLSRTDPTGYCYAAGPLCQLAGAGGGFTNVTQTLTSWNMSWRIEDWEFHPRMGFTKAEAKVVLAEVDAILAR